MKNEKIIPLLFFSTIISLISLAVISVLLYNLEPPKPNSKFYIEEITENNLIKLNTGESVNLSCIEFVSEDSGGKMKVFFESFLVRKPIKIENSKDGKLIYANVSGKEVLLNRELVSLGFAVRKKGCSLT